jgi:carboxyl-terminal processing protease
MENNPKGLVIDLRNNPGGSLTEVVEIADELLGNQMIVYTENRVGQRREFKSGFLKLDIPMTVLVNGGSASASEILAGAIQDSNSGEIIGETTFGKGIVQTVIPLDDGTGFKLTTSQYFTPNGRNIHGIGIEPDVVIEMPESYYDIEEPTDADDVQLQKAIEVLETKIGE